MFNFSTPVNLILLVALLAIFGLTLTWLVRRLTRPKADDGGTVAPLKSVRKTAPKDPAPDA